MDVAGLLFIVASVLKIHQLLTEPILSEGFWESWLFFVIQIPLELGLGIWLTSRLFRKAAWLIVLLSFAGFICVTSHKVLIGAESCGCFGLVKVNPLITLIAIDIPLFLLLAIFRPKGQKLLPPPWPSLDHFLGVAVPTIILLTTITVVLALNKVPRVSETWKVHRPPDKKQIIKPETNGNQEEKPEPNESEPEPNEIKPTGPDPDTEPENAEATDDNEIIEDSAVEEWPLMEHIDIADTNSLRAGITIILLYHYDCPDCEILIPLYDEMSREFAGSEDAIRFAFIEIPPYGPAQESPVPQDTHCLTGKLDTSQEWLIESPLVVVTWDGLLVEKWKEGQSPDPNEILDAIFADD